MHVDPLGYSLSETEIADTAACLGICLRCSGEGVLLQCSAVSGNLLLQCSAVSGTVLLQCSAGSSTVVAVFSC